MATSCCIVHAEAVYKGIFMGVCLKQASTKTANETKLYYVECPQYSTRLEALGYLCDCLSGRVQR